MQKGYTLLLCKRQAPRTMLIVRTSVGCLAFQDMSLATEGTGLADDAVVGLQCLGLLGAALLGGLAVGGLGRLFGLGGFHLLDLGISEDGDAAVACIVHHLVDDVGHLLLQLLDKLLGIVGLVLDVTQLLLPDTRQLAALQ